jgi:uncharacterized protein (DUF885 family)
MVRAAWTLSLMTALWGCGTTRSVEESGSTHDAAASQAQRTRAFFEAYWEATLALRPEAATFLGDHRHGDRWSDVSAEGEAREAAHWKAVVDALDRIDVKHLGETDRLSVAVLRHEADDALRVLPFRAARSMTVHAGPFPFQSSYIRLLQASPVSTEAQVEQLLARMARYPQRMEQELARMREGLQAGWVPPRPVLGEVVRQLDTQLASPIDRSAYAQPFRRLGDGIPVATREALRSRGLRQVQDDVMPAIRKLRDFVAGDYMAAAPDEGGLSRYPGGAAVYAALVRMHTTTTMTADDIHRVGVEQMARLSGEMEAVRREVGFAGDMAAFRRHLNTDPRFFHASPEAVLTGYRDITKRIDPELPRLFAELPRATYGVRALPDFLGPGAPETYSGPALDGTRSGWFNANTVGYRTRPIWAMETTAAHEGAPGHHLQIARAVELTGLPAFRRAAFFTAFGEGWALYAETLGPELGLYRDPYSRYGFLQAQAWRAARLVVDTGLHARGWTRGQAIDYLRDATGFDDDKVVSEVDRYLSQPGQALSYMVGQLKILELRERASRALGARFDLRRFHMALLDNGQLPLDLLEQVVDRWIAAQAPLARR